MVSEGLLQNIQSLFNYMEIINTSDMVNKGL